MKTKSFLLNILFFILAFTFIGCEVENVNNEITQEQIGLDSDVDLQMIDKEELEEPDDRQN
ncbi:hypothetical protein [Aquimarina algiphila]|uniref:Uncharacterized protein n=1 Tax=Aquimarina algiphila TaxID=2047982 RepID=A0A554VCE0_9FLAO|nr:hypothetical protein [Aquimarina algiphila]TSE04372.1 hypothetical protein FOF46_26465 [Aquimarina algiphila]